jgi:hypothetical protein
MENLGFREEVYAGEIWDKNCGLERGVHIRPLEISDGLWGEGLQPGDGSKSVTIKYLLTVGGFRNAYYILSICGCYNPPEICPETRTGGPIGETREERLAELLTYIKKNALKEAKTILDGKINVKSYSIEELFKEQLRPEFRSSGGKVKC